jgi:hypothetical protein
MDDFEKKLQRQRLRPIPGGWRETILRTAQERAMGFAALPKPLPNRFVLAAWRELVRPCRYAWATIAALWLVFWIVNTRTEITGPSSSMASIRAKPQGIGLIEEKRRALVELTGPFDSSTAGRSASPKPHAGRAVATRNC